MSHAAPVATSAPTAAPTGAPTPTAALTGTSAAALNDTIGTTAVSSRRASLATLAGTSLLVCCLAASITGTVGAARSGATSMARLTIAGTTVSSNTYTPVPRVRVTVMPESTVTFTDDDGDFLVPWEGHDGWITLIPEERSRNGSEWCKRIVLRGISGRRENPLVDLGPILVTPRAQLSYLQVPTMPASQGHPASMRAPGPSAGEPDTCRVYMIYATDLWGRITRIGVAGGDSPSVGLRTAIFDWIRSVPWVVATETACGSTEPFEAREWMDYAWADTAWVRIPPPRVRPRAGLPGGDSQDR